MGSTAGNRLGQLHRSRDSNLDGSDNSRDIDSENLLQNDLPCIDKVSIVNGLHSQAEKVTSSNEMTS